MTDRSMPQRLVPPSFEVLISNYPPKRPTEAVLCAIETVVELKVHRRPNFKSYQNKEGGILVRLPNKVQRDAVVDITGTLILNYPIWIIRQSTNWSHLGNALTPVFRANSSDGIVDLGYLAGKIEHNVDFSKRDFVEFLLFRLGTEARDDRFWVTTLIVAGNEIQSIDPWASFLHFLPHLEVIDVRQNPIKSTPILPDWPELEVKWDEPK
jgi:hypothetical protein